MAPQECSKWHNSSHIRDQPIMSHQIPRSGAEHDHHYGSPNAEQETPLETSDHEWSFLEEVRDLYFFRCGAPCHVVAKHVGEEGC